MKYCFQYLYKPAYKKVGDSVCLSVCGWNLGSRVTRPDGSLFVVHGSLQEQIQVKTDSAPLTVTFARTPSTDRKASLRFLQCFFAKPSTSSTHILLLFVCAYFGETTSTFYLSGEN